MKCTKFRTQYVGKTTKPFHKGLKKHRWDTENSAPDTIPACRHFSDGRQNFLNNAKFTVIEKITNRSKTLEEKNTILLRGENFWITELKTLKSKEFNQELNNI